MKFILVLFTNKDFNNPCVIDSSYSRTGAEEKAQDHLRKHPEDAVHIYNWLTGYEASTHVQMDRQWDCPQLPPQPAPEIDELVHPAVIDAIAGVPIDQPDGPL